MGHALRAHTAKYFAAYEDSARRRLAPPAHTTTILKVGTKTFSKLYIGDHSCQEGRRFATH
jgi:hypothetical protein